MYLTSYPFFLITNKITLITLDYFYLLTIFSYNKINDLTNTFRHDNYKILLIYKIDYLQWLQALVVSKFCPKIALSRNLHGHKSKAGAKSKLIRKESKALLCYLLKCSVFINLLNQIFMPLEKLLRLILFWELWQIQWKVILQIPCSLIWAFQNFNVQINHLVTLKHRFWISRSGVGLIFWTSYLVTSWFHMGRSLSSKRCFRLFQLWLN